MFQEMAQLAEQFEEDFVSEEPNSNVLFQECRMKLGQILNEQTPNPWCVQDMSAFLRYHCPECPMTFKKLDNFGLHARSLHPRSKEYFHKVKPNNLEYFFKLVEKEINTKVSQEMPLPSDKDFQFIAESVVKSLKNKSQPSVPQIKIKTENERVARNIIKSTDNKENKVPKPEYVLSDNPGEIVIQPPVIPNVKIEIVEEDDNDGNLAKAVEAYVHEKHQQLVQTKLQELSKKPYISSFNVMQSPSEVITPKKDKGFFPFTKIAIDIKTKEFRCMECENFTGVHKFELVHHFLEEHNGKQFNFEICQWCQEVFENSDRLMNHHAKVHAPQNIPRKVYMCEKPFCTYEGKYSFTKLRQHMAEEHESSIPYMPFKCDQCDSRFLVHEELSHHMNVTHQMNLIQFQCETCPMAYYDRTAYFIHKKSHNKNFELFFCQHCNDPHMSRYELFLHHCATHRLETSSIREMQFPFFACELCKFYNTNYEKLTEHMEDKHGVLDFLPIPCLIDGCQQRFEDLMKHTKHRRSAHMVNGNHLCTYCGKTKSSMTRLVSFIIPKGPFQN